MLQRTGTLFNGDQVDVGLNTMTEYVSELEITSQGKCACLGRVKEREGNGWRIRGKAKNS